jgi:hypothetical protein
LPSLSSDPKWIEEKRLNCYRRDATEGLGIQSQGEFINAAG